MASKTRWPVSQRCGNPSREGRAIAGGRRNRPSSAPGPTRFGENRVQEAIPKWRALRARAGDLGKTIELHLIGSLQSNKAREAVETFDVIETVDREKIAAALAREIDRVGKRRRLFIAGTP